MLRAILVGFIIYQMSCTVLATIKNAEWIGNWNIISSNNEFHQEIRQSNIIIKYRKNSIEAHPALINENGEEIGTIGLSNDGKKIIGCNLFPTYEEVDRIITIDYAKTIVERFAEQYLKDSEQAPIGDIAMVSPKYFNREGRLEFFINYVYRMVIIKSIRIDVDPIGNVVSFGDYDILRVLSEKSDMINIDNIIKVVDIDAVRTIVSKYLESEYNNNVKLVKLERNATLDAGCLHIYWSAIIEKRENNILYRSVLYYRENDNNIMVEKWIPYYEYEMRNRDKYMSASCPSCGNDGKIIWATTSRWKRLPPWIDIPPSSIAIKSEKNICIYRPLPDIKVLNIEYHLPSISPDNHWLAFVVNADCICFLNMQSNRIIPLTHSHKIVNRISWSKNSKNAVFVDSVSHKAYSVDISTFAQNGTLCENPIAISSNVESVCFVGSDTLVFALSGDEGKLVTCNINECPLSFIYIQIAIKHILRIHDDFAKQEIFASSDNGLYIIKLPELMIKRIEWIDKLGNNYIVNYQSLDWGITNDGNRIYFDALDKNTSDIQMILSASIDGEGVRQESSENVEEIYPRYALHSHYTLTVKEFLPLYLIEKLHYTDNIITWPTILPPGGPWDRTNY